MGAIISRIASKTNLNCLPSLSGEPFSVKILQAQAYWRGNKESTLPEVLIDGRIEVTEIVEEFGAR